MQGSFSTSGLFHRLWPNLLRLLLLGLLLVTAPQPTPASLYPPMPHNLILMIGDGMGFAHLDAAGYRTATGYNPPFACFTFEAAISTYPAGGSYDPQRTAEDPAFLFEGATDSAAAATALATGHKTERKVVGMARDSQGRLVAVENLLEAAEKRGRATGVVTSVPISHATPAGFVAHVARRNNYRAIAQQMLLESAVDVIAGAGHPRFDDDGRPHSLLNEYDYVGGKATWQLLKQGKAGADADGDGIPDPWTLVDDRASMRDLAHGATPKRLLLLAPAGSTLQQKRGGARMAAAGEVPANPVEPTLAELTRATLNALDDNPQGFVLVVEGGAIDWAGHANQLGRMIEELDDFAAAVAAVTSWIEHHGGWKQNLLLVTADHETGGLRKGRWSTVQHSNALVPLLARGAGSADLQELATGRDPVHGIFLDNAELGRWLLSTQHNH